MVDNVAAEALMKDTPAHIEMAVKNRFAILARHPKILLAASFTHIRFHG
jgi:hypothetical protein